MNPRAKRGGSVRTLFVTAHNPDRVVQAEAGAKGWGQRAPCRALAISPAKG